jgi:Putative zinc-finger
MNHKKYSNLIDEYFFGEINNREKIELEEHLKNCDLCRSEFNSAKILKDALLNDKLPEPDEKLLRQARNELRTNIRTERTRSGFLEKINNLFSSSIFFTPRLAAGAVTILLIGVFAGYLLFNSAGTLHYSLENPQMQNKNPQTLLSGDTRISNIHFINKNAADGTVDFTFDAVKPMHISGKINDPGIQNVLLYSMLNEDNPGTRLNTINLINSNEKQQPDDEIKNALLSVVKFDNNQGVRLEAMKLLKKFDYDGQLKKTMLYVLQNDSSSAMRIEAMNRLVEASKTGGSLSPSDLSILREKMEQDKNNYIRYQAKIVLKENK